MAELAAQSWGLDLMWRVCVVSILTLFTIVPQLAWLLVCVLMGIGYGWALWLVATEHIPRSRPVDTPPVGG